MCKNISFTRCLFMGTIIHFTRCLLMGKIIRSTRCLFMGIIIHSNIDFIYVKGNCLFAHKLPIILHLVCDILYHSILPIMLRFCNQFLVAWETQLI